jgi:hypothetical protein
MGAVVREAVHAYVTKSAKDRVREGYRMLDDLVGLGTDVGGKTDVSENHDRYVEEAVWERRGTRKGSGAAS